ncbi:MAG: hypothetical protein ACT4TC_14820 [Myxococcaceae bacterium]
MTGLFHRLTVGALMLSYVGCATGGMNSGNSSAGSNSAGSANSSRVSDNSSNSSNDSSASSRNSNLNQSSQDSTANSSRNTTQNSSRSNSSNNGDYGPLLTTAGLTVVVAGLGVLIWAVAIRPRTQTPEMPAVPVPDAPVPAAPAPQDAPGAPPPPLPPPSPAQVQAAQVYLKASYAQLQQDLAVGAGRSVQDLAAAAEIRRENLGRFGRILRTNRKELIGLLNGGNPTSDQAVQWLRRIGELSQEDVLIKQDAQAFLQRHAG